MNLTTTFSYDSSGYGDLTQVQYPYGGHLRWSYRNFSYLGGRTVREVGYRYLLKDVTASETGYALWRDDGGDASRVVHWYTVVGDPTGAQKVFWNNWNTNPAWSVGLMTSLESRGTDYQPHHRESYTWSQDGGGNPYISQKMTTLDENTANQRVSKVTTSLDSHGYGNVTSSAVYDYAPSSPSLSRTTTTTYYYDNPTNGSQYDPAYIRNRVWTQTVTPAGGSAVTMVTNTYDTNYGLVTDAPDMRMHDPAIGTSFTLRGNVTNTITPAGTYALSYDIEGNMVQKSDALGHTTSMTVDSYGNVPATTTPNANNNLATSFSFNSFLGLTSIAQPSNQTPANVTYDAYGRVSTTTSPDGAVTRVYYCPDACSGAPSLPATRNGQAYTKVTVLNSRFTRETYDGLGRVIRRSAAISVDPQAR